MHFRVAILLLLLPAYLPAYEPTITVDTPPATPNFHFDGVTIDPALLPPLENRKFGIPAEEQALYHAVLDHVRQLDPAELRAAAETHLRERKAKSSRFRDEPDDRFPLFVDLFRSPAEYQGKPVTLHGHLRRLISYRLEGADDEARTVYEGWLYTEHSQTNPTVVVCSEVPEGIPFGDEMVDHVTVTGIFYKMYVYSAQDSARLAPMVIANRLQWNPPAKAAPATWQSLALQLSGLGVVLVIAVFFFLRMQRKDRSFRQQRMEKELHFDPTEIPPADNGN